jgi:hypothetical protein
MRKTAFLALSLLLGSASAALAQDDPCVSRLGYGEYLQQVSEEISNEGKAQTPAAVDTAKNMAKAAVMSQLANRANADGLTDNRLDLLHRAFVALGLGQVDEEDGQLVFNFNPEALKLGMGQFSPRVIVHDAVLSTALAEKIDALPEDVRGSTKDSFEKQLGSLDDIEAQLRWTNASGTPDAIIQELASDIFQSAYEKAAQAKFVAIAGQSAELHRQIKSDLAAAAAATPSGVTPPSTDLNTVSVGEVCAVPAARVHFLQFVADLREQGRTALTTLGDSLTADHFFDLADLIDGEPHFTVEAAFRRRVDAVGQDVRSASLRYEIGNVSYRDFKSWAKKQGKDLGTASAQDYLEARQASAALPKFSLSADYSSSPELRIPLAAGVPDFVASDASKISVAARGGLYFGGGRDRRLELEATYDDVSDDPARQDRLIGKLSWVEKMDGMLATLAGSDLVVTLVYASKPEFRGDVDQDLGVRFGLKWSLGAAAK